MKKLILSTTLLAASIMIVLCFAPLSGTAFASVGDYDVISPALDTYLFLDTPQLAAVSGKTVAVYDSGAKKVYVAGETVGEYSADFLNDGEKVISLAFAGDLYLLTDRSRLYDFSTASFVDMSFDALTMTSENGKLYFYNGLRTVYVYDGLSFTNYSDNSRLILSSTEFTVSGNTAYFYKENKIYSFLLQSGQSAAVFAEVATEKLLPSSDGILVLSGGYVTPYAADKTAGETILFYTDIKDVCADGSSIALLSSEDKAVYRYSYGYELQDTYGCSAKKDGWYDNPQKVVNLGNGKFAVWDKGNNRVEVFDDENFYYVDYQSDKSFSHFTAYGNNGYFISGSTIYAFALNKGAAVFTPVSTSLDIVAAVAGSSHLFVYDKTTGNICIAPLSLQSLSFNFFCVSYNRIYDMKVIDGDSPVVYAETDEKIEIFTTLGKSNYFVDKGGAIAGFDVDAVGNIYTLKKVDGAFYNISYARSSVGYAAGDATRLNGTFGLNTASSFVLDTLGADDKSYTVDSVKNLLVKIKSNFVRNDEYVPHALPDVSSYDGNISFVKSKGAVVYSRKDNYNDVCTASATGSVLAVFEGLSDDETLFVMTDNGKFGYVAKNGTVSATPLSASGTVIALHNSVNVYELPSSTAKHTEFDKAQVFTLVDDCADFGGGTAWYKVSYSAGGASYYGYIIKSRVMSYTVIPEIEEPVYAKAKSSRLGAKVTVYAMADEESAVIAEITDGTKIKLLEDYDENKQFTLIEYNGATGYVLTADLQLSQGLTGGQIAAIVLASVTVVITALYLILSRRNKKAQRSSLK